MLVLTCASIEASAFNVLYFHDAAVVDVYTILQLKRLEGLEGLHLLNAKSLTKAQLTALKELPLKELGLDIVAVCGDIRRTIAAMPSIRKLELTNVVHVSDACLDMFSPQLVDLDIRNVQEISPAFAKALARTRIKKLNIASVKEFNSELISTLKSLRIRELNIGSIDKLDPETISQIQSIKSIKVLKFGIYNSLNTSNHSLLSNLISD